MDHFNIRVTHTDDAFLILIKHIQQSMLRIIWYFVRQLLLMVYVHVFTPYVPVCCTDPNVYTQSWVKVVGSWKFSRLLQGDFFGASTQPATGSPEAMTVSLTNARKVQANLAETHLELSTVGWEECQSPRHCDSNSATISTIDEHLLSTKKQTKTSHNLLNKTFRWPCIESIRSRM